MIGLDTNVLARYYVVSSDVPSQQQSTLARNAGGRDASEATLEVLARQIQAVEPLASDEEMSVMGRQIDAQRC